MGSRIIIYTFLALIAHLSCMTCYGQESISLEDEIQKVMADYQAIGASVVVVKDNEICYHHTFGYNPDYNDPTLRNPIPDDGIFWIASVSKTFISTAIMQLVEKKKLKLDDDVNRYLNFTVKNPHYADVPVTIRMLLCHRSSINDKYYGWNLDMMQSENEKEYVESFNNYKPGTKFAYCNLNYSLLGAIIENVTGMRFDQYIDQYICMPLGLTGSFNLTMIDSAKLVRTLSFNKVKKKYMQSKLIYDYQYVKNKLADYRLGYSTACLSPAGGMKLSAMDLAKWMMVHINYGQLNDTIIVSKKSELAMWTPQGTDSNYGFAFSRYDKIVKGENFIGMTGGAHGINSVMFFNPEKKYGFVVITNGYVPTKKKGHLPSPARELVRPLYKHFIKQ